MGNATETVVGSSPREGMAALANAQPLSTLCESLLLLDVLGAQGDTQRLARAVTVDGQEG